MAARSWIWVGNQYQAAYDRLDLDECNKWTHLVRYIEGNRLHRCAKCRCPHIMPHRCADGCCIESLTCPNCGKTDGEVTYEDMGGRENDASAATAEDKAEVRENIRRMLLG